MNEAGYNDSYDAWSHFREAIQLRLAWLGNEICGQSKNTLAATSPQGTAPISSSEIFVVHGHNGEAKANVARFIERLKLKPIILHEQANQGLTIIEKFEAHANVGYAIVLLTADDIGGTKQTPNNKLKPRARQNVIFELGYFIGRLSRNRVCALYESGVEIPSDYDGVVYVSLDGDAWHLKLAKEIKAAGFDVDLNNL